MQLATVVVGLRPSDNVPGVIDCRGRAVRRMLVTKLPRLCITPPLYRNATGSPLLYVERPTASPEPLMATAMLPRLSAVPGKERSEAGRHSVLVDERFVLESRSIQAWCGLRHPRDLPACVDSEGFAYWLATPERTNWCLSPSCVVKDIGLVNGALTLRTISPASLMAVGVALPCGTGIASGTSS